MKLFLVIAAAIAGALPSAFAADATFSKDCRHVYLAPMGAGASELTDVDLPARSWRTIKLPSGPVRGVTLSSAGSILCATLNAVWSFDPSNGKCVKICDAPD